jgi:hypothetical protein
MLSFLGGVVVFIYRDRIPSSFELCCASLEIAISLTRFDYAVYFAPPPVAYFTIYLGLLDPKRMWIVRSGDYSYGFYIYSYAIPQTVFRGVHKCGVHKSWLAVAAVALPLSIGFAIPCRGTWSKNRAETEAGFCAFGRRRRGAVYKH